MCILYDIRAMLYTYVCMCILHVYYYVMYIYIYIYKVLAGRSELGLAGPLGGLVLIRT